jgi:hypothetical protein
MAMTHKQVVLDANTGVVEASCRRWRWRWHRVVRIRNPIIETNVPCARSRLSEGVVQTPHVEWIGSPMFLEAETDRRVPAAVLFTAAVGARMLLLEATHFSTAVSFRLWMVAKIKDTHRTAAKQAWV